jgi:hypothetical protein
MGPPAEVYVRAPAEGDAAPAPAPALAAPAPAATAAAAAPLAPLPLEALLAEAAPAGPGSLASETGADCLALALHCAPRRNRRRRRQTLAARSSMRPINLTQLPSTSLPPRRPDGARGVAPRRPRGRAPARRRAAEGVARRRGPLSLAGRLPPPGRGQRLSPPGLAPARDREALRPRLGDGRRGRAARAQHPGLCGRGGWCVGWFGAL